MKLQNYLGQSSIDSLKLSFDIDEVDVVNMKLLDHKIKQTINTVTGEVEDETPIQQNSLQHQYENYKIHFAINKNFGLERVVVLLNSKLLEVDYMNGISMSNIESIYAQLMSANIFEISFSDFLSKGQVSDVDIKKDVLFESIEEFDNMTKQLENSTHPSKQSSRGANRFTKSTNKGIQWNIRKKSSYRFPYLKIYHKGIESKHGDNQIFFNHFLDINSISNVVRIEATIKNFSTQGVRYGLKGNSLLELLKMDNSALNEIINHSLITNIEPRIKRAPNKESLKRLTAREEHYLFTIEYMIKDNHSIESIISNITDRMTKKQRYNHKKELTFLYETRVKNEIYETKSRNTAKFFDEIGWF